MKVGHLELTILFFFPLKHITIHSYKVQSLNISIYDDRLRFISGTIQATDRRIYNSDEQVMWDLLSNLQ
jgi:hypothetical protein